MDSLTIYIDRLKDGKVETLSTSTNPDFIDVHEDDLQFVDPIVVEGSFYLADDHLIGNLHLKTYALLPCAICAEMFKVPVIVDSVSITEPIADIPSGLYKPHTAIREALLLELPPFFECCDSNCPERSIFADLIKTKKTNSPPQEQASYLPFKDL